MERRSSMLRLPGGCCARERAGRAKLPTPAARHKGPRDAVAGTAREAVDFQWNVKLICRGVAMGGGGRLCRRELPDISSGVSLDRSGVPSLQCLRSHPREPGVYVSLGAARFSLTMPMRGNICLSTSVASDRMYINADSEAANRRVPDGC